MKFMAINGPDLTTGDLVGKVHTELAHHAQVSIAEKEREHFIPKRWQRRHNFHDPEKPSELPRPVVAPAQIGVELADRGEL